jgi:hypothetical protein
MPLQARCERRLKHPEHKISAMHKFKTIGLEEAIEMYKEPIPDPLRGISHLRI